MPRAHPATHLWLDFVNTDEALNGRDLDALRDFPAFVAWLESEGALDRERAVGMLRRAREQPAGAGAALIDARRVRSALRALAERGGSSDAVRAAALGEINRVLGRSAGTRRLEQRPDGSLARTFAPVGEAYASLMISIAESVSDTLIAGELDRVRRCAAARCARIFYDASKNARRRWCDMARCGNRAKAARFRSKRKQAGSAKGRTGA
ncbi:MAG: CGNR zinc finger domain-containing protein [Gemmatimonadaceae bacterium]